jgi:leucyl aminopeptidase
MNLYRANNIENSDNLIVLADEKSDFTSILSRPEEIEYLKNRIGKDKSRITINQYNRLIVFYILKNGEKSRDKKLEDIRNAGSRLAQNLSSHDVTSVKILALGDLPEELFALAEGISLSTYRFLKYVTDKEKKQNLLNEIGIYSDTFPDESLIHLRALVKAVYKSRDLVNEPLSYLTAVKLASEIEQMGKEAGISVEILSKKKIESLKMGGLLAVNRGSIDPPTFTIMEYKPSGAKNSSPLCTCRKRNSL